MLFRMAVETMKRKSLCPPENCCCAVCALNASPAEHVAHHLEYIELAARQQCELLVFPSLSLLGCDERNKSLPAPPDEALLQPLTHAADTHHMTIIVGMPVEHNCRFVKASLFLPHG